MRKLLCLVGWHDWTCLADQGIKPDPVRIRQDPLGYFKEYAEMFCKRCGKIYAGR